MGLDVLEIGINVEELFDIEIADEDYETFVTVGDVYRYVLAKLDEKDQSPINQQTKNFVWKQVLTIVSRITTISMDEIQIDSRFREDLHC